MSNDPHDSSYDLKSASAISARLARRGTDPEAPAPAPEAGGFVRFSVEHLRMGARTAPAREAGISEPAPTSPEITGSAGWAKLLDWCVSALGAEAAFVVDNRGLIVGSRGRLPQEEIDEIGARLLLAFDQADHMSPGGSQSISIERGVGWLLGLRVPLSDGERLTLGVVSNEPISRTARSQVEQAFARKARSV